MNTLCVHPRCSNLATYRGKCAIHGKGPGSTARGYGYAHQQLRRQLLAQHPTCQWPGCTEPSSDLDHIQPLSRGGSRDKDNAQVLCAYHNRAKGNRT